MVKGERKFPADQGTSATSHGDGTPGIDESLVAKREEAIKAEKESERKLRDEAKSLLSSSKDSGTKDSGKSEKKS